MKTMVIAINYMSAHLADAFLERLDAQVGTRPRCLIVDNSVDDAQAEALRSSCSQYEWAEMLVAPSNLGYLGGFRFGVERLTEVFDWVIMSNLDVLLDTHAIGALERDAPSNVGLVGPDIIEEGTGRSLNPFMERRPSVRSLNRLRVLFRLPSIARLYVFAASVVPRRAKKSGLSEARTVFAVHGSAIALSRDFLSHPEFLDYPAFLFGEEIFLGELCRRASLRAVFLPSMRARHVAHATTGVWRSAQTLAWQRNALGVCVDLLESPEFSSPTDR